MKATTMVERTTRTRRVVMREEALFEGGRRKEEGGKILRDVVGFPVGWGGGGALEGASEFFRFGSAPKIL
jgi:hypothetical protein